MAHIAQSFLNVSEETDLEQGGGILGILQIPQPLLARIRTAVSDLELIGY